MEERLSKFILSHQGFGDPPATVESRILDAGGVRIVDRFDGSIVVEGRRGDVETILGGLRGWFVARERRIGRPGLLAAR